MNTRNEVRSSATDVNHAHRHYRRRKRHPGATAECARLADSLKNRGRKVLVIYRETGGHSTDHADTVAALEFVVSAAIVTGTAKSPGEKL